MIVRTHKAAGHRCYDVRKNEDLIRLCARAPACLARQVCERVADLYPKNYYAWTQRSWVVLRVVGGAIEGVAGGVEGGMSSSVEHAEDLVSFLSYLRQPFMCRGT